LTYKLLHITPHLGGGVGSTILGYISKNKTFEHEILSLGYTMDYVEEKIESLGISYKDNISYEEIIKKIPDADIILIHQWNHPLLYDFLVRTELPPCRVVMWGHNSGFHPPNIYTEKILRYPDLFVFTTPLSYKVKDVEKQRGFIRVFDVWSTDGVDEYINLEKKKHKGFVIGYIGTVDYAKMHPNFLGMCELITRIIHNVKFVVVGGAQHKEIEAEAKERGLNIEFTGYVHKSKLKDYLSTFDVFGYPLAPYHYGTCDLVLQIAMGAGVPSVVFDNDMEKYMVKNNKTGIIVRDMKGYVQAIKDLYNNINWRKEIGRAAREEAIKRFTLDNLDSSWERVLQIVLKEPKTPKKWRIKNREEITHADVFIESLGHYGNSFKDHKKWNCGQCVTKIEELAKNPSWQTETKGSVHNYHSYFPDDPYLKKWSEMMK